MILQKLMFLMVLSSCVGKEEVVYTDLNQRGTNSNLNNTNIQQTLIFHGGAKTCAILQGQSELKCWGAINTDDNSGIQYGFVGADAPEICNVDKRCASTPTIVQNLPDGIIKDADSSFYATCIVVDGSVYCWGKNGPGTLGFDASSEQCTSDAASYDVTVKCAYFAQKISIPGNPTIVDIEASVHSFCALSDEGEAYCWGYNGYGQLGFTSSDDCTDYNNTYPDCSQTPQKISSLSGIKKMSVGFSASCFVLKTGVVRCVGEVGDGVSPTVDISAKSLHADFDSGMKNVFIGALVYCAQNSAGKVYCFGYNQYGDLGRGTSGTDDYVMTEEVEEVAGASKIGIESFVFYAASNTFCALVSGSIKCWGNNDQAQAGGTLATSVLTPTAVVNMGSGFTHMASGLFNVCGINQDRDIYCAGHNSFGGLGNGTQGPSDYSESAVQVNF